MRRKSADIFHAPAGTPRPSAREAHVARNAAADRHPPVSGPGYGRNQGLHGGPVIQRHAEASEPISVVETITGKRQNGVEAPHLAGMAASSLRVADSRRSALLDPLDGILLLICQTMLPSYLHLG